MPPHDATPSPTPLTEARLHSIIDSAMDAIITIDDNHHIVLFNKAAQRLFGVPEEQALGSNLNRFIPERFRSNHAKFIEAFGRTGATRRQMGHLDPLHGLRGDGSEFPIEASISHSAIDGQHLMTVILRDISDRKRIEEQLLHAQKMEVIGRLAGGIAHDFNNLLMATFNYLALATRGLDADHPSRAPLTQVHEVSSRAARLTRQLLTFARKQAARPVVLAPGEVLTTIEPMLRQLITDTITLSTTIDPQTPTIRADPSQIEQVLMNLVVNARDAMPNGGTISISAGPFTADTEYCIDHPGAQPGRYATLAVTDTGIGMSDEILARIFEPFFTTKEPGKGTGLGLATCHGIVTQSGGHLTVNSLQGRGTTIRVLLPASTS